MIPGDIGDAARLLRAGELTSTGLTAAVLARADDLDGVLGVYLDRYDAAAMDAAARADRELAAGVDRGPLHGIPVAIKDILTTADGPTTAQSLVLDRRWGGRRDAPAVARLRAAGAVITGKATTAEFATGTPDPTKPFPLPRNPWDPTSWTGGSSSGTAAGVAAGLFLGGLGTDTGGSIRVPSAYCGVTGLKPTFGRVPKTGCVPLAFSQDHVGPIARTARDCGLLLQAIAGHHRSDPNCADVPVPDMTAWPAGAGGAAGADRDAPLAGLRVGVVRDHHFPDGTDPAVPPAFADALSVLGRLGADLVDVALPRYPEMVAVCLVTIMVEALAYHRRTVTSRWADYSTATRLMLAHGAMVSAPDYVQAQRVRRLAQLELAAVFGDVDVAVMPTASVGAPDYDTLGHLDSLGLVHTMYWNATGNPVLVVPMGFTDRGRPLSLQLAAAPFAEPLLVAVGDAFQQATDWHRREPPMVARLAAGVPAGGGPPEAHLPLSLPMAPTAPRPPDPPPSDQAVADVSTVLSRAGLEVTGDDLVHLAGHDPWLAELVERLHRVDVGEEPPAVSFDPVARSGGW